MYFKNVIKYKCYCQYLFQKYQEAQGSKNKAMGEALSSTLSLLEHTSRLISLFSDKCPISSVSDSRLQQLKQFYSFFAKWRAETKDSNHHFISSKLWFDLQSMCIGFVSMVSVKITRFPQSVIKPAIVNQDCVENHFCQVRACNGQNNNPTYRQQESTQNSIRFGQTTISRKSNAGHSKEKSLDTCSFPVVKKNV